MITLSKADREKFIKQYPYFKMSVLMHIYDITENQYKMLVQRNNFSKLGTHSRIRIDDNKAIEIIHSTETCEELAERLEIDKEIIFKFRELL